MDPTREISAERLPLLEEKSALSDLKEKSILVDIAQETQNEPGLSKLSQDELMEKVENILLERIKIGEKRANFQLGLFYFEQGLYDKARIYFERAKDYDYQALFMLSSMLYDGLGGSSDPMLAVEYLKKIATSDSIKCKHLVNVAQYNIGRAYFQGYGVKRQSDQEAERWWLLAADDGNPKASIMAQTILGMYYSREDSRDLAKAFFWHSEACGNGSVESQGALGVMYEHGIGVQQDSDSAYVCLKESADRGNVYAMGNLVAHFYRRKLYTKAADLASKISKFNDVDILASQTDCLPGYISKGIGLGCFYYARCLHEGHGIKQNEDEAKNYYSKAYLFDPDICARLQAMTQQGMI